MALIAPPSATASVAETGDVVGLHLAADGLSWERPTGNETLRRSLTYPAASPVASFIVPLGHVRIERPMDVAGNGTFTAWVTTGQAAVLTQLRIELYHNAALVSTGDTRTYVTSEHVDEVLLTPEVTRQVAIEVPMAGLRFGDGDVLEVAATAFGVAANGVDHVDIIALFGSADRPSGLIFPLTQPPPPLAPARAAALAAPESEPAPPPAPEVAPAPASVGPPATQADATAPEPVPGPAATLVALALLAVAGRRRPFAKP